MEYQHVGGPYSPPRTQFVDLLRYWADQKPDEPAYLFTDGDEVEESLSYAQLWQQVRGLAGYLQQRGQTGRRILLLYPPGLDFVIGFYACHAAGAVAVPAFPPRRNRKSGRIRWMAQNAAAEIALTNRLTRQHLASNTAPEDLQGIELVSGDLQENRAAESWYNPHVAPNDIAVLQYTSGSTGNPKGVMLTHANLVANCELINKAFCPTPYSVGLTWLPTYHDMGLVGGVLQPMFIGRPNVLMSPMTFLQRPIRWLQAISKYRVTISGGPNFAYQLCVDKITDEEMSGLDLRHWATAFNGAEPVRSSTIANFSRRFASVGFSRSSFLPCYGMAETTLIVTGGPAHEPPVIKTFSGQDLDQGVVTPVSQQQLDARSLVGCGCVLPGEQIVIVDRHTYSPIGENRVGEIWVRSESVGQGYWQDQKRTAEVFEARIAGDEEPWLRTGDLGFLHAGQLYITGRVKDMIIVRGVNRYPQDIELTVERHSAAVEAGAVAAFAAEAEDRERLIIVAETVRRRDIDWHAEIAAIRRAVTAQHDLPPDAIYLVRPSSVPKTSSGKIQRHACQRDFEAGELKVVAAWDAKSGGGAKSELRRWADRGRKPQQEILTAVVEAVQEVGQERAEEITPDTNIALDVGLDSLERMQIAHRLEEAFGARFPEEVLQEVETVRHVALAIEDQLRRQGRKISQPVQWRQRQEAAPKEGIAIEYEFEMLPEVQRLKAAQARLERCHGGNPYFVPHEGIVRDTTVVDGKELISFSGYNYLGMSGEPRVSAAAKQAIDRYGTSVSASRLVSGEKPLHRELEEAIASFVGAEAALVFVGGHSTNESVIGHLVGASDLILHDALAHNSIIQGGILSGATRRSFPHNDWSALDALLAEHRSRFRRVLIVIEGIYSMDGDIPDLNRFVQVKRKHHCWLMVDEAHSLGTLGATGRGVAEYAGVEPSEIDIAMATLSKSLASCGGSIAGNATLIEYLRYTVPGFVYSVGIPPAAAAAALASIRILASDAGRVRRLQDNSRLFHSLVNAAGFNTGAAVPGVPIVPVILGDSQLALQLSAKLSEYGVNVHPIVHPAVAEDAARLRFFITSCHTAAQLRSTVEVLKEAWERVSEEGAGVPLNTSTSLGRTG